ncbi:MAG: hypothetical protein ABR583_04650 [Gaiellaceae bacterium]
MDDQDTQQATEPTTPDRAAEVAATEGREDDRNEEVDGSPVPDPTDDTDAEDVPGAD